MKILYAEDEKPLSMAVTEILKMEKFEPDPVYDGKTAYEKFHNNHYDAAILDIMMPEMSGIEVLEKIRSEGDYTPVLLLTAKSEVDDKIDGLSAGADDYLAKPFAMKELIARVKALLRRSNQYKTEVLSESNLSLNCESNEISTETGSLRLSPAESELLAMFLKNKEYTFTSDEIKQQLLNGKSGDSAVNLYISYLQNKLQQIKSNVNIYPQKNGYKLGDKR